MQCWLDVALKLAYMPEADYKQFDERYERLLAQIITMIQNADRWCTLTPTHQHSDTPIRRYVDTQKR